MQMREKPDELSGLGFIEFQNDRINAGSMAGIVTGYCPPINHLMF